MSSRMAAPTCSHGLVRPEIPCSAERTGGKRHGGLRLHHRRRGLGRRHPLAARLSENPGNKVLLLEAGAASHPYSRMPLSFGLLIDNPAANWLYQSEPEPGTANRTIPVPRGNCSAGRARSTPGLGARPAARLRHLGADGLPRLELARGGAPLRQFGELRRRRRQAMAAAPTARSRSRPCPTRTRFMTPCLRRPRPPTSKLNPDYNGEGPGRRREDARPRSTGAGA